MLRINTSPIMHMKEEGVCIHLCPCLLYKEPLRYGVGKLVSCCHCIVVWVVVVLTAGLSWSQRVAPNS